MIKHVNFKKPTRNATIRGCHKAYMFPLLLFGSLRRLLVCITLQNGHKAFTLPLLLLVGNLKRLSLFMTLQNGQKVFMSPLLPVGDLRRHMMQMIYKDDLKAFIFPLLL